LKSLEINAEDESVVDEQETRDDLVKSNSQRRTQIDIKPKFIVLDTNCFIDYLELIDKLLATSCFVIFVPLLVINELEKLAKASYGEDSTERAEYLQHHAKKSLNYLTEKFSKRERYLKALTSQGSALDSIQFRTEEIKEKVS
jgi:protein SMG6